VRKNLAALVLFPTYPCQFFFLRGFLKKRLFCKNIEKMIQNPEADSLRIITPSPITPYKMWVADEAGETMKPLMELPNVPEFYNQPRQKLPKVFWQIGALDVIKTSVITEQQLMSGKNILPHIVDTLFAVDIDDISSFDKAAEVISTNDCIKFNG